MAVGAAAGGRGLERAAEQESSSPVNAWSDLHRKWKDHYQEEDQRQNHDGPCPPLPQLGVHLRRDREEPRRDGGAAVVLMRPGNHLDEHLLRHFFGGLAVGEPEERFRRLRPDLIRTWACGDGPIDREYVWHDMAQQWQTPEVGEAHHARGGLLRHDVGLEPAAEHEALAVPRGLDPVRHPGVAVGDDDAKGVMLVRADALAHLLGGEQPGLVDGVAVVLDLHGKAPHADHRTARANYVRFELALENFVTVWNQINFGRLLFNTFSIAMLGTIGTLLSSIAVAYGFSRFRFRGRNALFLLLLATIILPVQITLIPTFAVFLALNWTGTWLPLIVPHFFANAYNVFLLRQYFVTIPREMDEAAMMDGANPLRILTSIIVPQSIPVLVAVGLFHFFWQWNDFFLPLIYLQGNVDAQPLSVGIASFNALYSQKPTLIQAAAVMSIIVPVVIFFFAQRAFMRGIVITGVEK